MKIGLVTPHIFMQDKILPHVIFSPGQLALELVNELAVQGHKVTLYSPGKVTTQAKNVTADLTLFEKELNARGDNYLDLLKKHPLTFISLARQVQTELIAGAFADANADKLDVVHIYMNEEDIALPFAQFCQKPVLLTHHDPYSFLVKYRAVFPKYKHLDWLSLSLAQRSEMPPATNWAANIYHGLDPALYQPVVKPRSDYIAYLGRIIEPKGIHLAIAAVKQYNLEHNTNLRLKIAGKHYSGTKDQYWQQMVQPYLDDETISYVGFIKDSQMKNDFIGNALALIVPSLFNEPFGMVAIEALACGTPIICLANGALPEIVKDGQTGTVVKTGRSVAQTISGLSTAIDDIKSIDRTTCRKDFEERFTIQRMAEEHALVYQKLTK